MNTKHRLSTFARFAQAPALLLLFILSLANSHLHAATIPANSKILFLGAAATTYKNSFMGIYTGDNSVNSRDITASSLDSIDVLEDFYHNRKSQPQKNALLTELDKAYDYIVFIPNDLYLQTRPELTMEAARVVKSYTQNMGTKVVMVMLWNSVNAANYTSIFEDQAYRISDAHQMVCIPAGLSWKSILADGSLSVSQSSSQSPSTEAAFALAATLYSNFFEQNASQSTYTNGLGSNVKTAITNYSYSAWNTARTATHYTGAYTKSFCKPWAVPHQFGVRNWGNMGTSSELRTGKALVDIINRAGESGGKVTHIDGYKAQAELKSGDAYGYFPYNLYTTYAQDLVSSKDFDFLFGRSLASAGNITSNMAKLQSYDTGGDVKFIILTRHFSGNQPLTNENITGKSSISIDSARSCPDVQGVPNYIGLSRAWQERPDLILNPDGGDHLSGKGYLMQAGMIYTVVSGGQNPTSDSNKWTADEQYVLNLAYKLVTELGGLKHVVTRPIAYGGSSAITDGTPVNINFDGIDLDGLPMTVNIVSGPAHGTLSGSGSSVRKYTATSGFSGADSITYTLNNGIYSSLPAVISISVTAGTVNTPPSVGAIVASPASPQLPAGTTVSVTASDIDSPVLSYAWSILSGPGTAAFATPTLASSAVGFDLPGDYNLGVAVSDGLAEVNRTVTIHVLPTPWQAWSLANFGNATASYTDDSDNDGYSNLMEYALGGDPKLAQSLSLSQGSIVNGRFMISFTRTLANTDVTITVQGADSPAGPWTDLAISSNGLSCTPLLGGVTATESGTGVTRNVQVGDLYPLTDPARPRRFLRVRITL